MAARPIKPILVVEDDNDIREILRETLEIEGYQVITAENGLQGLEMLKNIPQPCLILLDLLMPVMDGATFLKEKAKLNLSPQTPVVVISAVAERTKLPEAHEFLKKPVAMADLLGAIERQNARMGCR